MKRILLFTVLFFTVFSYAQKPDKPTSSEIYESIKKLNFLGTALYIAAHPDDENQRLISYFANNLKARTGYLSLTRGDGGQNRLGVEIRELLGVIRTQELLAARRTDGGEQFFSRANDFGYSKHPDETLQIWNKEEVLSDVVWVIRKFKPDVIVNRFSHKPETFGNTHGHHTSSALLSELAFDLAGDKAKYPEQLKYVDAWQPKREFFNTYSRAYASREDFEKAINNDLISIDVGTFYPSFGLSNTEIASLSRSMHKSQDFGATGSRGERIEYLELVKGDMPENKQNLFEGINTTWTRVKGGKEIGEILSKVERNFDFRNPSASVSGLMKAYALIQKLEDEHWKNQKTKEIKAIIEACAGLYLEAVATESSATYGDEVTVRFEAINRSDVSMRLAALITIPKNGWIDKQKNNFLIKNKQFEVEQLKIKISDTLKITSPYWLKEKGTLGMYKVADRKLIGNPETDRSLKAYFGLVIEGISIGFEKDVVFKRNDPEKGEVYQPFEILPEATVGIADKVYIFPDNEPKEVVVKVKSGKNEVNGIVSLEVPSNWKVSPENYEVKINQKGAEQSVVFTVTPPKNQSEGTIQPIFKMNSKSFTDELIEIDYDHIPFQSVLMPSKSKVLKLDIKRKGQLIGYIHGGGDEVPESLRQVGYTVVELNEKDISLEKLKEFDAVILGIRAYNINDNSKYYQETLHDYVKKGGTVLVQYNKSFGLKVDEVSPMPIKLSRGRVTDEFSEVRFIAPNHEVMNYPNKITQKDFEGWVQERGLYFPYEWSSEFIPILSMNDKGKKPENGSLLVGKYGNGYFIYTGLSFFRELPPGVPGAYRLFTNLLSIGKNNIKE